MQEPIFPVAPVTRIKSGVDMHGAPLALNIDAISLRESTGVEEPDEDCPKSRVFGEFTPEGCLKQISGGHRRRRSFAGPAGLSRDQIRGFFHGHVTRDRIEAALE
jgi:hypothetical protein